jgi:hypothetical protein
MSITPEEFEQLVSEEADLKTPLLAAAAAIPLRVLETLDTSTELATIVGLFPVVSYIVKEIGLPWRFDPKRYTELWREKFRPWIEGQYSEHELHPYAVESFGNALRHELEVTIDRDFQVAWERFALRLTQENPPDNE